MSREMTPGQKWSTFAFTGSLALLLLMALLAVVAALTAGCRPVRPTQPQTPPPATPRVLIATVRLPDGTIVQAGTATLSDDFSHKVPCVWGGDRLTCTPADGIAPGTQGWLRITDVPQMDRLEKQIPSLPFDAITDLGELHLRATVTDPPLLDKVTLIRTAQENFGAIKLAGCDLHMNALFDPFLLERWVNNRPCFERMMAEHARRNDNTVTVDPRAGYHGFNDIDAWHQPELFTAFIRDVRRHTNAMGEHFRVRVFLGGDGHIDNMRSPGAFEHWQADVTSLAIYAAPYVEFVVPCWECRHDNSWVSAKLYYDMLAFAGQRFPRAVHSVHLVSGSSAPSSWPCDPFQPGSCAPGEGPPSNDIDDPARGSEPGAWPYMLNRGLVDEFLYQFDTGGQFMYWPTYPANADAAPGQDTRGALGRWWDIVVRLGDDPWSRDTACAASGFCGRRGWRQVPIKAWEFIYDRYWDRDPATVTEDFQNAFCRKALALGAWGCGSASVRR